jgi:hypothetical protein
MITAVTVLMIITSMGIFGFLSKAHNDQTLVSGDVGSKIAVYDEKIKTSKDNIDANRKALKQMDEAVDQVMGRSSDEKGADKAVAIRKAQQKERSRLLSEITTEQTTIGRLNEERAPIAAEVRKVEAEVGPIKYIAAFIYGTTPDETMLEKAVTWIIILIVVVFDPLAVIMLLAAQMTFGWAKTQKEKPVSINDFVPQPQEFVTDEIPQPVVTNSKPEDNIPVVDYKFVEEEHEPDYPVTADSTISISEEPTIPNTEESELEKWNKMIAEAEAEVAKAAEESAMAERLAKGETYIDGEGIETALPETVYSEDDGSKKKTYMIKDPTGQVQTKNRE